MYIKVMIEDEKIAEFWNVRAWHYSQDGKLLWIFFLDETILCGYMEKAKVVSSFTGYEMDELLPNDFLDLLK